MSQGKLGGGTRLGSMGIQNQCKNDDMKSPFNLVYGSPTVIPTKLGMETYRTLNYDEDQNMGLLRENLDLIEEKRKAASIKSENYKRQIKVFYNKKMQIKKIENFDLVLQRADAL